MENERQPQDNQHNSEEYKRKKVSLQTLNIITFSHDHVMLRLPCDNVRLSFGKEYFYDDFEFYKELVNYKGQKVQQVPVIRLFGANKYGQKCCLNVHCYFPYFYIKADKIHHLIEQAGRNQKAFLDEFCGKVEESFSKVFSQGYQKYKPNYASYKSLQQIIHKTEIVYKKDFYGYHSEDQPFIKIYYYNPSHGKKLIEILISGAIMNLKFQIYEVRY